MKGRSRRSEDVRRVARKRFLKTALGVVLTGLLMSSVARFCDLSQSSCRRSVSELVSILTSPIGASD